MCLAKKKEAWALIVDAVNAVNSGEKKSVEQVMSSKKIRICTNKIV